MRKDRLLKLADFLDTLPRQKFDFTVITRQTGKPMLQALRAGKEKCGTVACAVGWMPAVWPRLLKWNRGSVDLKRDGGHGGPFDVAVRFFAISLYDVITLFDPHGSGLGGNATPKQVAKHIRRWVASHS